MDPNVRNNYTEFKNNPFGEFKNTIAALNLHSRLQPFILEVIVQRRRNTFAYLQALYDNNLISENEYLEEKTMLLSRESLMSELEGSVDGL